MKQTGRLLLCLGAWYAPQAMAIDVRLCTDAGTVEIALEDRSAPAHSRNFARYVNRGFYNGTVFHRVVADNMVQGGSYDLSLTRRQADDVVASESANGLSNVRGTIAASRGDDPDSATSQFFFNLTDNSHLDATARAAGYTVFGRVTAGLDVLDEISRRPTAIAAGLADVPQPLVAVVSATVIDPAASGPGIGPDPAGPEARFEMARAGGDATSILAAVDDLRRRCATLRSAHFIAEAEAAMAVGNPDRARYGLAQYLARANPLDALLPRAQRLYASLPAEESGDLQAHVAHCRRPAAPAIPTGRAANLPALQTAETAVLRYRQLGRLYLDCLARVIDGGELSETETIEAIGIHNDMVIEITTVLTQFNAAARDFRSALN